MSAAAVGGESAAQTNANMDDSSIRIQYDDNIMLYTGIEVQVSHLMYNTLARGGNRDLI